MSNAWVIDASVGFAWIHPSQASQRTDDLLGEIENGAGIVVPEIWFAEIANCLLVLMRRKKLTPEERKTALNVFSRLTFVTDNEGNRHLFGKTSDLAQRHGLTIYDAIYLELALRRKLPLATRDAALNRAAKKEGLKILPEN